MQAKANASFHERKRHHKEKKETEQRLEEHIKLEQKVVKEAQTIIQGIEEKKANQQQPTNGQASKAAKPDSLTLENMKG